MKETSTKRYLRLIREKMSAGMKLREAVRSVDQEEPGLRQRVNEIETLKRNVELDETVQAKADFRESRKKVNAALMRRKGIR
jgi:hypothetical protein